MNSLTSPLAPVHPGETSYDELGDATIPGCFTNIEDEYQAIRERAGLIDLCGSRIIEVSGSGATEFLQQVLARDVEFLTAERCMTSLVLDESGHVVDIVVVWGRDEGVLLESSPGQGTRLLKHLRSVSNVDVTVEDRSGSLALVGLEGPYAWGVVGRLIDDELASLPFESVADTTWDGVEIIFARTGVTGEYGYQAIVPRDTVDKLWVQAADEVTPVGNRALELAMLEVRQPITHLELAGGTTVIDAGVNWLIDITKEDFIGRAAVLETFRAEDGLRTVGFRGGESVPDAGARVSAGGEDIGVVVHTAYSQGLGAPLGLARVKPEFAAAGLRFDVDGAEVETLTSPYVTPKSWSTPII